MLTYNFYFIFSKLVGFGIFGIGIYAWIEKDTFTRISELSIGILFDPAFIFLIVGGFIFIIGFCGINSVLILKMFRYFYSFFRMYWCSS